MGSERLPIRLEGWF
uniref:Uncharacterized protein n=1 Tax=Arundo donax TaxID=35708 RepID=A0A0A8Y1W2_ARUDO